MHNVLLDLSSSMAVIKFVASPSYSLFSLKRALHEPFSFSNSYPSSSSSRITNASKRPGNLETHGSDRVNYEKKRVALIPCSLSSTEIVPQKKKLPLNFKSLFGQRALWRKILFDSTKFRSIILLNAITIVYASNIAVVKEVEEIMDPAAFSVVRFVVAALPFTPFVVRSLSDVKTRNSGIELGFWVSLGYLMQAIGLLTSDAGRASFISIFTIIVVPLLDGMLGAIIPARTWFGALMSILGVWMLESSGSSPCIGDLFNFLSAVFFGVHMLRTEHISRTTTKDKFLPLLGYETCVVALFSMVWYFGGTWSTVLQDYDPSSWTWDSSWECMVAFPWIPALYTGVCLWIEMTAMCDVSAKDTAVIYGLEPLWGAGFAWFILGERWGTAGWIGAALVLGGSLTVQLFGSSPPPKKPLEGEESREEIDCAAASRKQGRFSTSPIVVISLKDTSKLLEK
ncbi:PREDICTED: uncharacterized protein LOC104750930 [Camelina sativa]|uniref:Uncharacterized protein LOC104750930 n=1 Tax=Camelina sativa TaxID=90675 RepID=A0ABM0WHB8_CAMSA|nr:PREDICTED: uncharacterized protein LOC104750930 [Camelina sativa]